VQRKERTRGIDHVEEIGDCWPHLAGAKHHASEITKVADQTNLLSINAAIL